MVDRDSMVDELSELARRIQQACGTGFALAALHQSLAEIHAIDAEDQMHKRYPHWLEFADDRLMVMGFGSSGDPELLDSVVRLSADKTPWHFRRALQAWKDTFRLPPDSEDFVRNLVERLADEEESWAHQEGLSNAEVVGGEG